MDVGRGRLVYIWITPDPVKARPTLGGVIIDTNACRKNKYYYLI